MTSLIPGLTYFPTEFVATHLYMPWCVDTFAFRMVSCSPVSSVHMFELSIISGLPSFSHEMEGLGNPRGGIQTNSGWVKSATWTSSFMGPNRSSKTKTLNHSSKYVKSTKKSRKNREAFDKLKTRTKSTAEEQFLAHPSVTLSFRFQDISNLLSFVPWTN